MLEGESKLYKHGNAQTIYLSIPSTIACDSQFPLKSGDTVTIEYRVEEKLLVIRKKEGQVK